VLLSVYHLTEYRYPEEARDSFNQLWLYPVDDSRQALLEFRLGLSPEATLKSHSDFFGNRVHRFHIVGPHRFLRVEMQAKILTFAVPEPKPVPVGLLKPLEPRFFEFLAPTSRVPLHPNWLQILRFRRPNLNEDLVGYLLELTAYLGAWFRFDPEATKVDTPLLEAVQGRAGVCQDYSHAMIAVLRSVGIPARYVSGYVLTGVDSEASHAWVEVFVPGAGWLGYDPTNHRPASQEHIKTAHGRDYDDCPPLRGSRTGGGKERLEVSVRVEEAAPLPR
jgi:transglutaminase-like putative cysteine protease